MALIASLFALVGRFVGRVLTTTLGWASVLLFGRIPQDRQIWLAVLTFGSLAWVAVAIGVLVPDVGAFLLAALPIPDWVPQDLVRLAMLVAAIVLPAVIGAVTLLLQDPEDRPKGTALLKQVAMGYALVPTLAVTLVVLAIAGTLGKLDSLIHRRQDAHVAVVVRPGRYDSLVNTLEETLRGGGLVTSRGAGPSVLTIPAKTLAKVGGGGIGRLVPDRLVVLQGPEVKVSIYPADLAITGSKDAVPKARALIARDVPSRDAWFTTTKEAQKLEDQLAALETADAATREAKLPDLDARLLDLEIDQETFEVLYRRRLQLAVPPEVDVRSESEPERPRPDPAPKPGLSLGSVVGIVLAALSALDIVLTALLRRDRRARSGRRFR
ncbi:MAG TPA: hypothetical protein VHR16_07495 [Candidatus Limnocylindrales bacterium]|jgi:hypothetical protein|nr:hypothetical protein [Candidatus Limnocylindrales bacterium]